MHFIFQNIYQLFLSHYCESDNIKETLLKTILLFFSQTLLICRRFGG
jgi:hypothetical protein